jgi:phosphate acetyltransferase
MVSGLTNTTQHTISPSLQLIKTKPGLSIISSLSVICMQDRMVLFGYSAAHPTPDSRKLADIAVSAADSAASFGLAPGVVMLAKSKDIGPDGPVEQRVSEAVSIAKRRSPGLEISGPLSYQAAYSAPASPEVSSGCGFTLRSTVCICPDLQSYKAVLKTIKEMPDAKKFAQVFQGMKRPVNSLSQDCTIEDIINIVTITAVQAQAGQKMIDEEDADDLSAANEEQYHIF